MFIKILCKCLKPRHIRLLRIQYLGSLKSGIAQGIPIVIIAILKAVTV